MLQYFEKIQDTHIEEIHSQARYYRHIQTGAELLSLENDDEHKVFGITFRTPPHDSTGIAHILEHSVLCGSRKYPVKEPFVELIKSSLRTYLNALTYPDKTCYPAASQNTKDFYNLIDVYLDAVFYPRLTPEIFSQEGWHYELNGVDQPLTYKGVVFNEMKGAYSSPERLLAEYARRSLFPDTTYGISSGGEPNAIPDLTYEQFQAFHKTYYNPSNVRIFFYGDDDPEERLRIIHEYLKDFSPLEVKSRVTLQPPFKEPRKFVYPYAIDERRQHEKQAMVTVNWLLTETDDTQVTLAFQILGYILVGMLASPLRKALIESGLGEDIVGGGMNGSLRQMYFSTGLKGVALEDTEKVEELIYSCLNDVVQEGIDPHTIEAALNTIEFHMRENNTGSSPRGLSVMLRSLVTWLHDGDPIAPIAFEKPLAAVREQLQSKSCLFEEMITHYIINNRHCTTVVLRPDPHLAKQQATEEKQRLEQAQAAMSDEEKMATIEQTHHLKEMQQTPDSDEALATIPMLQLNDLDRFNKIIPLEALRDQQTDILYHNLDTSGIVYFDIGLNFHVVPQELLPYAALFCRIIREMGTEKEDYTRLAQRIGRKIGSVRTQPLSMAVRDSATSTAWLFLRSKATMAQVGDMFAILSDMLLTLKLDNQERFRQIVLEEKARKESSIIPGGSGFVNLHLRASFNEADWANEQIGGISYLNFLRGLVQDIDANWQTVLAKLEQVRQLLINRHAMICNVTVDQKNWGQVMPQLQSFLEGFPIQEVAPAIWQPDYPQGFEGLIAPTQINFVGKATDIYRFGYQRHGSMGVITNFLRTTWLWDQVRVQGGAYGCFCRFGRYSGVFVFVSYRDPNLLDTLQVYDQAGTYLREVALSETEVTRNIIGAISHFDAYQFPDAKGFTSMIRHLTGHTDAIRQEKREEILSTTTAHFREFADMLDLVRDHGNVVVLGSEEAIAAANEQKPNFLKPVRVL